MKNINIGDAVEISPSETGKEDWDWTRATVVDCGYTGKDLFEWVFDVRADNGDFYSIKCADNTKIRRLNEFTLKLPIAIAKEVQLVFDAYAATGNNLFEGMQLVFIAEENVIGENKALVRLSSYSPITPDALFWLGHECAIYNQVFEQRERTKKKLHRKA